jgi:hypothetical protein
LLKKKNKNKVKKLPKSADVPPLTINSYTWTKESHGLFDYDLKDVLNVNYEALESVNILRKELNIAFSSSSQDHLIAKLSQSGNRHWWIYH